ncbi:hypothetical protein GCM10011346_23250 [Oceanobacillus neutriphilus]|uniref:Uncharacterized protein n=1 Tax=Oceanobacillus neutriphilus TaxID=531815 RepID=A0ABQ2NV97_9BACI|nr:hypothetical protein GCM10011346_23250 [Oceanobacillus neutriphilus]
MLNQLLSPLLRSYLIENALIIITILIQKNNSYCLAFSLDFNVKKYLFIKNEYKVESDFEIFVNLIENLSFSIKFLIHYDFFYALMV